MHSKVPYFIFKRYIFHLRDKGLSNFNFKVPQEIDNHPDLFRGQFPLPFAEADSFNVLTSFSFSYHPAMQQT